MRITDKQFQKILDTMTVIHKYDTVEFNFWNNYILFGYIQNLKEEKETYFYLAINRIEFDLTFNQKEMLDLVVNEEQEKYNLESNKQKLINEIDVLDYDEIGY